MFVSVYCFCCCLLCPAGTTHDARCFSIGFKANGQMRFSEGTMYWIACPYDWIARFQTQKLAAETSLVKVFCLTRGAYATSDAARKTRWEGLLLVSLLLEHLRELLHLWRRTGKGIGRQGAVLKHWSLLAARAYAPSSYASYGDLTINSPTKCQKKTLIV